MGAAYYDTNSAIVRPWLVQVTGKAKDNDSSLDIDPLPTRVSATVTSTYEDLEAKGFTELDLKIGDAARIRQAYAAVGGTWGTLMVGQAYTLVGGWQLIDSFNLDAFFSQGSAWTQQPQIRFTRKERDLLIDVALTTYRGMGSVVNRASGGTVAVVELPELPYVQARVERAVPGRGRVSIAGAVGQFKVAFTPGAMSMATAFKKKATAAMVAADVVYPFGKHTIAAHGFYSRSGGNSSAVQQAAVFEADGTVSAVSSVGGFVNLVLGLGDGMRLSLFGTVDNPTDKVSDRALPIERNLVVGGMFVKELMPKLEAGLDIEYAETKSTTKNTTDRFSDIRTTIGLKYSL